MTRRFPAVLAMTGLVACLPGFVQAAHATPQDKAQGSTRDRTGHDPDAQTATPPLREETFRLMDAYLISNLQESIGLTDQQFTQVLPLVKRLQSDRRVFATKRMQALRTLRRSLNSGRATEAGVGHLLAELKAAVSDEHAATVANAEALDALLTPLQQAKYRVFEAEVDARLRRLRDRSQNREGRDSR